MKKTLVKELVGCGIIRVPIGGIWIGNKSGERDMGFFGKNSV